MAKDVNLLSYWMPLLRQIKEFKQIAIAEEPELKYILEAIDRTLANMFISTADEYGIKRFEDMIGIYPADGDSLETRRLNVLVKWNDKVPYTDKELYNRMVSICGDDESFTITQRYNEYEIDISTHLGVAGAFDTVASLLEDMLPCNLVLNLKNTIEAVKTSLFSVGVVTCTAMVYQITNDINREYINTGYLYYANGVSNAETHIITNDIKDTVLQETSLHISLVGSIGSSGVITHDVELEDAVEGSLTSAVGVGVAQTQIITHDLNIEANVTGNSAVASPVSKAMVITLN
nr:putative phage tail protein [uncultured Clostridium sp.]